MNGKQLNVDVAINGDRVRSLGDIPRKLLDEAEIVYGIPLDKLSHESKASLVKQLDKHGYMSMRGAVISLSRRLKVSRKCIYNWINGERQANM